MSESLPIPFAERLLQQALSQLSQLLILRVSADQIPLEELAKREHTLVYRERGQLCIQADLDLVLLPQQPHLFKGVLLSFLQAVKIAVCALCSIAILQILF